MSGNTMTLDVLNYILSAAIDRRASDVHIEPGRNGIDIRFRVDGILQKYKDFDSSYKEHIIAKTKVEAKMNITETRFPQDGHLEYNHQSIIYNVRISSIPTIYGEALVMRIMYPGASNLKLDQLGFDEVQLKAIYSMIQHKGGIIVTTGPTGSGKTNLLYSILNYLNKPEENIITLEDPVEYQLDGTRQTQIDDTIGFTFAKAMRSVVRQDPNVIMLGEIRDAETANMAVQASLIGILILTTFHSYNVPGLVSRLLEMDVTHSILGQSFVGTISSRLVRKICPSCRAPVENTNPSIGQGVTLYRGLGCEQCKNTGYLGRTGIFEVVPFDKEIKKIIIDKQSPSNLFPLLEQKQIASLYDSGLNKARQGITTIEEVARVLGTQDQ